MSFEIDHAAHTRPAGNRDGTLMTHRLRWQCSATSIDHLLFVPLTLGLAFLVISPDLTWRPRLRRRGEPSPLR